ncbi:10510_t:CDS:10, partial [Entrophospora sp. SA101]
YKMTEKFQSITENTLNQSKQSDENKEESKELNNMENGSTLEVEELARHERRQELRSANLLAWRQGKPAQLSAEHQKSLLKDIQTLTLGKYISEVVVAVVDGVQKCKSTADVWAAVEVISVLHQRFPDTFTPFLTHTLARSLAPPSKQQLAAMAAEQREKEEISRISKQRILLRIAGELWLMGVLRNVEDGIAALNSGSAAVGSGSVNGVKDNVAGFVSSPTKGPKEVKEAKTSGDGFMYTVLKDLLSHDSKHVNLPLVVSFLKYFGVEMLGTTSRRTHRDTLGSSATTTNEETSTENQVSTEKIVNNGVSKQQQQPDNPDPIVTPQKRELFKNLLIDYFKSIEAHLIMDHQTIKTLDHNNHEFYITKGEVPEATKQNYEKVVKLFDKFLQNAQFLADFLDIEMPDLPDEEGITKMSTIIRDGTSTTEKEETFTSSIWEDEDARSFYENLIDLKTLVPGVLLEVKSNKKDDGDADKDDPSNLLDKDEKDDGDKNSEYNLPEDCKGKSLTQYVTIEIVDDYIVQDYEAKDFEKENEQAEEDTSGNLKKETDSANKTGTSAQLDALLSRLPHMINRDLIDRAAVDFCYLNSKASRKKLIKTLLGVPRIRLDLLPYYSRLIATLNPHYPDITSSVLQGLEGEFKSLQRRKTVDLLETKIKVH